VRSVGAHVRRRRRAYHRALADPHASPAKVRKLRERATLPSNDHLRHIGQNKIGKAVSYIDRKNLWYDLRYKKYAPTFLGQVKPKMVLWSAALEEAQLPPARLPEVAVCGRSNSGKSTLINYLCGQHSAHCKRLPGSTTEIVFWKIGKPATFCFVDLPGYGFATATEEKRLQWTEFTLWYVRARKNLRRVLVCINGQAGIKPTDREMISYLERHGVSWQIIVTKCDKVKKRDLAKRLTVMEEELTNYTHMAATPIPVSALKRRGMEYVRQHLEGLKVRKEVVKDGIKRRIYDLLELKRINRVEKAKRKREEKEAKLQQEQEAELGAAGGEHEADFAAAAQASRGKAQTDLHKVLSDWGFDVPEMPHAAPAGMPQFHGESGAGSVPEPKPLVTEAHYSTEDRDSQRVAGFMRNLLPDTPPLDDAHADLPASSSGHSLASSQYQSHSSSFQKQGEGTLHEHQQHQQPQFPEFPQQRPCWQQSPQQERFEEEDTSSLRSTQFSSRSAASTGLEDTHVDDAEDIPFFRSPRSFAGGSVQALRASRQFLADQQQTQQRQQAEEEDVMKHLRDFPESVDDSDSDTDSDDEVRAPPWSRASSSSSANVLRFDANSSAAGARGGHSAFFGERGRSQSGIHPPPRDFQPSPFPGFGQSPGRMAQPDPVDATRVRHGWARPGGDRLYEADDLESEADRRAAVRRFAPPSPTSETRGSILAQARRRYEREWAMELEDVEEVRSAVEDSTDASGLLGGGRSPAAAAIIAKAQAKAGVPVKPWASPKTGSGRMSAKRLDQSGLGVKYITQEGDKPLPKGAKIHKFLGKPPPRVLKDKYEHDAGMILRLRNKTGTGRKRNLGAGLDYDEARARFEKWYKKTSRRDTELAMEAPSPAFEDVEAAYDDAVRRRSRRFQASPNGRAARSPGAAFSAGGGRKVRENSAVFED